MVTKKINKPKLWWSDQLNPESGDYPSVLVKVLKESGITQSNNPEKWDLWIVSVYKDLNLRLKELKAKRNQSIGTLSGSSTICQKGNLFSQLVIT